MKEAHYLMLLGWGPRDGIEVRPYEELEALFRLEEVSKASAFFDVKKLAAFNGWYIRALTVDEFIGACQRWLVPRTRHGLQNSSTLPCSGPSPRWRRPV